MHGNEPVTWRSKRALRAARRSRFGVANSSPPYEPSMCRLRLSSRTTTAFFGLVTISRAFLCDEAGRAESVVAGRHLVDGRRNVPYRVPVAGGLADAVAAHDRRRHG